MVAFHPKNFLITMNAVKSKAEMTEQELLALEEAEFQTGPLSVLTHVQITHLVC